MLTDLSYSKADLKEEAAEEVKPEMGAYPWGLQIRLEDEELTKLGLMDKLPEVGGELHMMIVCNVTGVSQTQMAGGDSDTCVTLQVCMADVIRQSDAAEEKSEPQTVAYEAAEMASLIKRNAK